MKSIITTLIVVFFCNTSYGELIVANNNPGAPTGTNVYTTFAAALGAAANGDIIYLVPSSISYGIIAINKSVTIFGAGLIPDKDLGIKTIVGEVRLDASNVRISGLVSTSTWYYGHANSSGTYTNITIENCRFGGFRLYSGSVQIGNVLIRNNVITIDNTYVMILGTTSSVIVTNNIFHTYGNSTYGIQANGVTFSHNIFRSNGTTGGDGITINNVTSCLFQYNIFYGSRATVTAGSANTFNYNLTYGNTDNSYSAVTGTGNVVDDNPMFVNLPLGTAWVDTYDLSIGSGSAADNIDGAGGIAGVTGGATPWDPDGSLLPTVQSINIPSVVPAGVDLEVNIKGKGN